MHHADYKRFPPIDDSTTVQRNFPKWLRSQFKMKKKVPVIIILKMKIKIWKSAFQGLQFGVVQIAAA